MYDRPERSHFWLPLLFLAGCNLAPGAPDPAIDHAGATLVVSGGPGPAIVLTAPAEIAAALASLPRAARATLLETGVFESDDPVVIETHLRVILDQPSTRLRGPRLGPTGTTWGKIKDRYRNG